MEFNQKWIKWIMNCVTSVSYRILINGTHGNQITPIRGLRQGDPISPYLFLICMQGLSSNLRKMEIKRDIESIKIKGNSPTITHLLFVNDCYIFTKRKAKCAKNIKNFLKGFSKASRQTINCEKSEIIFSKYTPNLIQKIITKELRIKQVTQENTLDYQLV